MNKDIIYREDAVGAINGWLKQNHFPAFGDGILYLVPSVDRPQGEWEIYIVSPFDGEDCRCSECGRAGCAPYWNFCPYCGVQMKEVDDD